MASSFDSLKTVSDASSMVAAADDATLASLASGSGGQEAMILARREIERRKQAAAAEKEGVEQAALGAEQQRIINALGSYAEGNGKAYQSTMDQTNRGNARIKALSAGGRGGLNAGVNAANAIGISTAAGSQQAVAAREAEKTQARAALGQAIAQGQDMNVAQNRTILEALGATPPATDPTAGVGQAAAIAQGVYQATAQSGDADTKKKNQQSSGYNRW